MSVKDRTKKLVVVIGVSGTGKSTIGAALANQFQAQFLDADTYHPPENIERMTNGLPLTDEMRAGWLDSLCQAVQCQTKPQIVLACSALKKKYRDAFRRQFNQCTFVLLDVPEAELRARLAARTYHFMPASLLDSQLATLEYPGSDEQDMLVVDGTRSVAEIVADLAKNGS